MHRSSNHKVTPSKPRGGRPATWKTSGQQDAKSTTKKERSPPRNNNRCPLSADCTLLTCELEHPLSRTRPCTFAHPGPESKSRCSFLHSEDNSESYLRIEKRLRSSEGPLRNILKQAYIHLSHEIRGIARKRRALRESAPFSPEAKQEIHDIREMTWAMEEFGRSVVGLLDRYDGSPLDRVSTLSAMTRELSYYRPEKDEPYWLVYSERRELLAAVEGSQVTILSAGDGAGKTSQVPLYLNERAGSGPILCVSTSKDIARIDSKRVAKQYAASLSDGILQSTVDSVDNATSLLKNREANVLFTTERVLSQILSEPGIYRSYLEQDPVFVIDDALPLTKKRMKFYPKMIRALQEYPRMRVLLMTGESDVTPLQRVFSSSLGPLIIVPQN